MAKESVYKIIEKLESGLFDLFKSKDYIEWLKVMSRFSSYSFHNTLLIYQQKPDATAVAGYNAWQYKFNRHVKKGEHAIKIIAPIIRKRKKEEIEDEEEVIYSPSFKAVNVFDVSQTEGDPLPILGVDELQDDVNKYKTLLQALKEICPVEIKFEHIDSSGAKGYYSLTDNHIVVREGLSEAQTIKTLVHEMVHQKLHSSDTGKCRNQREIEAESVAYAVCQHLGIDTSDYTFGYIAGWSRNKEIPELKASMKIICDATREMIDDIDKQLEKLCA